MFFFNKCLRLYKFPLKICALNFRELLLFHFKAYILQKYKTFCFAFFNKIWLLFKFWKRVLLKIFHTFDITLFSSKLKDLHYTKWWHQTHIHTWKAMCHHWIRMLHPGFITRFEINFEISFQQNHTNHHHNDPRWNIKYYNETAFKKKTNVLWSVGALKRDNQFLYLRHNNFSFGIFLCLKPFRYHNALQKAQVQYRLLDLLS